MDLGFAPMTTFGERVKALRNERGWTQEELAHHSGLSRATIQNLEASKHAPRHDSLQRLSGAFDLSIAEIVNGTVSEGPRITGAAPNYAAYFAENLARIIAERDLSQQWLAARTGIHFTHISDYSRGSRQPGLNNAKRISDVLNVSLDSMLRPVAAAPGAAPDVDEHLADLLSDEPPAEGEGPR